jgi:farnesyl-diphosphate farnesyltransferase
MARPEERVAAMGAVREMAARAAAHLDQGLEYVLLLPRSTPRIRLFCMWPLLLAIRTLTRIVSTSEVLETRVRIGRDEVSSLTREATWRCLSNTALRRLHSRERAALSAALESDLRPGGIQQPAPKHKEAS